MPELSRTMNRSESLFLELLSSAIWDVSPAATFFTSIDEKTWKEVFRYASMHSVDALMASSVRRLPKESQPPSKLRIGAYLQMENIEDANRKLNRQLIEISEIYRSLDLKFLLLKGQGNALYYPDPLHRSPGDIDLFLYREGDYEKAKQWIKDMNYEMEVESPHHQGYNIGDTHIENHRLITYFVRKKYDRLLQQEVDEIIGQQSFDLVEIEGKAIQVLPTEMNAFFIFQHMFRHFIYTGTGMRQLCDWLLFLKAHKTSIRKEKLLKLAEKFDLLRPMRIFAQLAVTYLNASPDIFPFELGKPNRYPRLLMEDILNGGQFGFYRLKGQPKTLWRGRWHRYKLTVKRSFLFGAIAPSHVYPLPFHKLIHRVKLTLKGS